MKMRYIYLARLLEAIEKAEQTAPFIHAEGCDGAPPPVGYNGPFPCDCDVPEGIYRRRCAADREMVRRLAGGMEDAETRTMERVCREALKYLASGYGISLEQENPQ